jgi:hypothetical protein
MKRRPLRLLAIDLSAKGFGFALLDAKLGLLDWGFSSVRAMDDDTFLARVRSRIDRGRPTALALENFLPIKGRENAVKRRELAITLAGEKHIGTCQVSRAVVQRVLGVKSRAEVARVIAGKFPELQRHLPPERQRWASEDERMNIFDALSFALVVVAPEDEDEDESPR